jgi:hypothetical protein
MAGFPKLRLAFQSLGYIFNNWHACYRLRPFHSPWYLKLWVGYFPCLAAYSNNKRADNNCISFPPACNSISTTDISQRKGCEGYYKKFKRQKTNNWVRIAIHGIVFIKHRGGNFAFFISELTCLTHLEATDSPSCFPEASPSAAVTVENGEGGHKRHAGPGLPPG